MTGNVVVLAPSPQLTVTVEALDGVPDIHLHPGGQGVWQARMMRSLGVEVVLCATVGGETGRVLRGLLDEGGVGLRLRGIAGRNGCYIHDRRGGEREPVVEMPADPLSRHELDDLYELTLTEALEAGTALLSGPSDERVVPHELYHRLAADLTRNGCQVVIDLAGERLATALRGGPTFVKVSHEELIEDGRAASDELTELVAAAREIAGHGPRAVVVSRAAEPALALLDGELCTVHVPALNPVETRGGGDSMTAGFTAELARGESLASALRVGAAAGALNIARHGLGTGSGEAIASLAQRVELRPWDEKGSG
ncbi:PfkB family carbohydrate kinase [Crossiella sp. SN42]|uniref:1-phosphofructokinase family hexose kinase n=1 Tax=Crossiella sp. SN42 TaxID=2944808 RepID=UPI00207D0C5B|nr:PfkB family carbohydrate kinase [Crossiella sp. SN42]MCO1580825.1 PfkB family carbohydrate kinase [Crossiella sp. SN42]